MAVGDGDGNVCVRAEGWRGAELMEGRQNCYAGPGLGVCMGRIGALR